MTSTSADSSKRKIVSRFPASEWKITNAAVFSNGADVTRRMVYTIPEDSRTNLEAGAEIELVCEGITTSADRDSFRGSTNSSWLIQGVKLDLKHKSAQQSGAIDTDQMTALLRELKELEVEEREVQNRMEATRKRKKLVDDHLNVMLGIREGTEICPTPGAVDLPAPAVGTIDQVKNLLAFYEKESERECNSNREGVKKAESLQERINIIRAKLIQAGGQQRHWIGPNDNIAAMAEKTESRLKLPTMCQTSGFDATVRLVLSSATGSATTSFTVDLTYQVRNASWSPAYDLRVAATSENVSIGYFADVRQATGEDWRDVSLSLSTAKPSKGSGPPPAGTKQVEYKKPPPPPCAHSARMMMPCGMAYSANQPPQERSGDPMMASRRPEVMTAAVEEQPGDQVGGTAIFAVPKATEVLSDNTPHKVTITRADLPCKLFHYCAPSLSTSVFLQAHIMNKTDFTFLESPSCSVYIGQEFVAKVRMQFVSPGESFHQFLGTDDSVQLSFRHNKFDRKSGWTTKTSSSKLEHTATVRNNCDRTLRLVLAQQLPHSTDEKIKVKLIDPTESHVVSDDNDQGVGVTSFVEYAASKGDGVLPAKVLFNSNTNNIIWLWCIAPRTSGISTYSYSIDWPADKEIVVR
eukprot:GHVU01224876.1.p1 GENE.GHVU01224876.1~~GHVU01224876.1.p1  ORF type:complete len:636 (+),score=100.23 GHVU01224876.1:102-2009(+)